MARPGDFARLAAQRGAELRPARQPALDRGRDHRADHLPLLRDRLARALAPSVRPGRGAVVGGLHHRLRPAAPGRAAALADGLRAPATEQPIGHTVRVAATIQLGSRSASTWSPSRSAARSRTAFSTATRPSTGSALGRSPPTGPATSPAASSPAATGSPFTPLLIISESVSRTPFPARGRARDRLGPRRRRPRDRRRPDPLADRRPLRFSPPRAPARRARRRGAGEAAREAGSELHPRPRGRVRGGGLPDHAQRADLPQRRAADRQRHLRRRRRRLHLQHPDDRPGAAPALPGGLHQPPPPPHPASLAGSGRGLPRLGPGDDQGDRRLRRPRRRPRC